MGRLLAICAVAAFALTVLFAQGGAPAGTVLGPSLSPPDGALVAAGPSPALTLLYTGDTIGYIDPCG